MEQYFSLELWLFRFGYSVDIFSKRRGVKLSLKGKQQTVIEFEPSCKNMNFGKLVLASVNFIVSQYLKTFLIGWIVVLTSVIIFEIVCQICEHLEDLHNSVN